MEKVLSGLHGCVYTPRPPMAGSSFRPTQQLGTGWPSKNAKSGGRAVCRFTILPLTVREPSSTLASLMVLTKPMKA